MAEAMGEPLSASRLQIYANDLSDLSEQQIRLACLRARRELKFFPKIAELRNLADVAGGVDDGRPGPETAWAMCPKNDEASVVWTEEMSEALGIANALLKNGDDVGARMAFRESYNALVTKARTHGRPVRWFASLGWDKSARVPVLTEAIVAHRISVEYVRRLLGPEQDEELLNALPAEFKPKLLSGEAGQNRNTRSSLAFLLAELDEQNALPPGFTNGKSGKRPGMSDEELAERVPRVGEPAARLRGEKKLK